jgi:hypothetical protein
VLYYLRTDRENTIALISLYSTPDAALLQASHHTLWSCAYQGDAALRAVDVKAIVGVAAMVPLPGVEGRYFVVEKPGLDVAHMGGDDEILTDS